MIKTYRSIAAILLASLSLGAISTITEAEESLSRDVVNSSQWEDLVFKIDDSRTYVGVASVNLSVSELRPEGDFLVGEYSIRVPLKRSKNDTGRIVLPLPANVSDLGLHGGTLRGQSFSEKKDTVPNRIVCEILPGEKREILLAITTEDRTLHFSSNYVVASLIPPTPQPRK